MVNFGQIILCLLVAYFEINWNILNVEKITLLFSGMYLVLEGVFKKWHIYIY
jgi:hypothetical protein